MRSTTSPTDIAPAFFAAAGSIVDARVPGPVFPCGAAPAVFARSPYVGAITYELHEGDAVALPSGRRYVVRAGALVPDGFLHTTATAHDGR